MGKISSLSFGVAVATLLLSGSLSTRSQEFQLPDTQFHNGTTYIFTSLLDHAVITVHEDGEVTTEALRQGDPLQRWTVVTHPINPDALEFKHEIVQYNMLSGYQDPPGNPGIFPRPLGLANRGKVGPSETWNIQIRGRWCLQAIGMGFPMDMDDCEYFEAPWQLWEIQEVS